MSIFNSLKADQYEKAQIGDHDIAATPGAQFRKWFEEAVSSNIPVPEAMNVATAELPSGRVSNRTVLLKDFDSQDRIVFYSNWSTSRKGHDLATNPYVSVCFFWKELERQVRIEGKGTLMSVEESTHYFQSRPRESQIGAWASPQSETIPNREYFDEKVQNVEDRFEGQDKIPCPPFWKGLRIEPEHWEFWQGRKSRLHDRICFDKEGDEWKSYRIAP